MTIEVIIKTAPGGQKFSVTCEPNILISEFKALLETECSIPPAQQRLIYKGHVLRDVKKLEEYNVENQHTVLLVKGKAPGANTPASASSTSTSSSAASPASPANPTPNPAQPNPAPANPFANLMSGGMGGMGGLGGMGGMGAMNPMAMQQHLMQNPEMMRNVMQSPMVQSMMNNPELMQQLITSNPQIQAMVDSNPQLAHILNDPGANLLFVLQSSSHLF